MSRLSGFRVALVLCAGLVAAAVLQSPSFGQESEQPQRLEPVEIQTSETPVDQQNTSSNTDVNVDTTSGERSLSEQVSEAEGRAPTSGQAAPLPVGETFILANQAYEEGRYPTAVELYSSLVDAGHDTAEVLFNLGNAHLRAGNLGRSVASYRRSLVRSPRDPETLDNLRFARNSARDAIAAPEPSAFARTLFFWHYGLSRAGLVKVGAVLSFLFWGMLIANLYRRDEILRWATGVVLLALLLVAGSIAAKSWIPNKIAVVLPPEVEVYSGTDRESVVRFELHAGTEVRASRESGGWVRIELPDGQQGWIESEHVDLVVVR
jgi:hypothetical protein